VGVAVAGDNEVEGGGTVGGSGAVRSGGVVIGHKVAR